MSEWKESTLGDELIVQRGHDLPKISMVEGQYPVCSSSGILGYHNAYTHDGDGLTIGRSGHGIGKVFYYQRPFWAHNTVLYVKDFKGNFPKFFYYFLKNLDFTTFNTGSAIPSLNRNHLYLLNIKLPVLAEQKAIASVLSSLDDKIDLLHRQNKTLEAMAETLFRQWFIEEAKEDWEVSSLGDVVKIAYGKNLPTSRLLDSGYPVFGGNGQIGFYDRFLYSEPQVLVSCRGEASGKVNISLPNSFITNNSLVLERKENGISFEYLKFYALAYDFGLHVSGSAQPQITIDGLFNAEFRWPPLDLVESFTEVVRPLEDKRLTNYVQIQTLENLRDTLLPKLMSGEVRVQYQTEEVA